MDDTVKLDLADIKDEPQELYKEGMNWTKEDGPPPEGFTLYSMENGVTVLRRKRQRNLQKLGIGGFLVRVRGIRSGQDTDEVDMLPGQTTPILDPPAPPLPGELDKPRRKPVRRKIKSKLAETFPPYLQEAFFGKELLDSHQELDSSSGSDEDGVKVPAQRDKDKSFIISHDVMKTSSNVQPKIEKSVIPQPVLHSAPKNIDNIESKPPLITKEEDESDADALKDVFSISGDLLDTIMNEDEDELTKNADTLENLTDSNLQDEQDIADSLTNNNRLAKDTKDELTDILGSHFNLEAISNINSKDVEDIFKGVMTDESQESQESNIFPVTNNIFANNNSQQSQSQQQQTTHAIPPAVRPTTIGNLSQTNTNSPISFPPQSPYHSEYSK